jgi:hypothetical protein
MPIYSDIPMSDPGPRDVDAMMAAAQRWADMWVKLFEREGVERYQILFGVQEGGEVEWCDPDKCSTSRLGDSFKARIDACLDGRDLSDEGDRILEESGLGEFLYYDGWESGNCASDNPFDWPKSFWYEHYRAEDLHTQGAFEDAKYEVREIKKKLLR